MIKHLAIAGFATALLFGAAPTHASLSQNALTSNALTSNAFTSNALTSNALSNNALTQNAVDATAVVGRRNLGTTTGLRIIGVELPSTR